MLPLHSGLRDYPYPKLFTLSADQSLHLVDLSPAVVLDVRFMRPTEPEEFKRLIGNRLSTDIASARRAHDVHRSKSQAEDDVS